ncbi:MAG: hypothetical protein MUO35_00120, partial [Anaerolineales bacterium]|nr:hypothetical protein [Anaerolineales bacterium]
MVWPEWLKVAGFQAAVLWHWLHWPLEWLAGLRLEWHEAQSVWPEWLKVAGIQAVVLWHWLHWPLEWLAGLSLEWQE